MKLNHPSFCVRPGTLAQVEHAFSLFTEQLQQHTQRKEAWKMNYIHLAGRQVVTLTPFLLFTICWFLFFLMPGCMLGNRKDLAFFPGAQRPARKTKRWAHVRFLEIQKRVVHLSKNQKGVLRALTGWNQAGSKSERLLWTCWDCLKKKFTLETPILQNLRAGVWLSDRSLAYLARMHKTLGSASSTVKKKKALKFHFKNNILALQFF